MAGYTPTDLANQALDAVIWPAVLGDIEDGSDEARICLRAYRQCRMQLLRAVHWNFARKSAGLDLLADASGNTPNVGTIVPNPWFCYEYAYPVDCLKARFLPWNLQSQANVIPQGNIVPPNGNSPLVTGIGNQPLLGQRIVPAKFTVETDFNYQPPPQQDPTVDFPGISPAGRTVICTNVRNATLVYTTDVQYPQLWDPLFRAAFVAYLASEIAGPIWAKTDPKFGLGQRNMQIAVVKEKVMQARITDGNEGVYSSDIAVDWMRTRHTGGSWRGWGWGGGWTGQGDGPGVWGFSWDSMPLAGGSAF